MTRRRNKLAIVLASILACGEAVGLSSDSDQPINIEADRAEADDQKRTTIYRGDVIITQGTLKITGDTVTIYYDENGDLTKLVSVGRPARFHQLPDGKADVPKNYQRAEAKRMEYYEGKDLIVLLGDAVYGQGGDRVAAERIVYDSKRSRMKAESRKAAGDDDKPARVKIKIEPKKTK
ncbi:MAG: lipopolysaccharide transport periplasmic protein LptA [Gammaproteobacteria bacterium]|nr:lipopolysaccharide transport periplasmic protein LptA [Gammaproteobacteria bacterium]